MLTNQTQRVRWFVVFCLFLVAIAAIAIMKVVPTTSKNRLARRETTDRVEWQSNYAGGKSAGERRVAVIGAKLRTGHVAKSKGHATERESVAGLKWHTDYAAARREAERDDRLLLINFLPDPGDEAQQDLEQAIQTDDALRRGLADMVLVRLSTEVETSVDGQKQPLLDQPDFEELRGQAGIAILDLQHKDEPYYGEVVTILPFREGKYYRWQPSFLKAALDLPAGSITQRTMIWAVRVHPDHPASTEGEFNPVLAEAAEEHSEYQAKVGVQGHQGFSGRFQRIRSKVGASRGSEVVAESWRKEDMIDSCLDCVRSWRYSPGHWSAVRSEHDKYGYDIRRGRNGIWYGTGIFAD